MYFRKVLHEVNMVKEKAVRVQTFTLESQEMSIQLFHRKSCKGLHGVMKSQLSTHHLSTVYLLLTHQNTFPFPFLLFS